MSVCSGDTTMILNKLKVPSLTNTVYAVPEHMKTIKISFYAQYIAADFKFFTEEMKQSTATNKSILN